MYRPAAAYEAYRDRSDAVLAATGARPTAFLATLGPLATYSARASFARNLLALSWQGWASALFSGLIATGLSYLLWNRGLRFRWDHREHRF